MLNLLMDLRDDLGLTLVMVSHDLSVVSRMCEEIIVMRDGRIVEAGRTEAVLKRPSPPTPQRCSRLRRSSLEREVTRRHDSDDHRRRPGAVRVRRYLMVPDAIDPGRWIEPVMQEYETVLERLAAELLAAGRIGSLHDDLPFDQRFVEICAETTRPTPVLRLLTAPVQHPPRDADVARAGRLEMLRARACSTSWSVSSGPRSSPTRSSTYASRRPSRASRVTGVRR